MNNPKLAGGVAFGGILAAALVASGGWGARANPAAGPGEVRICVDASDITGALPAAAQRTTPMRPIEQVLTVWYNDARYTQKIAGNTQPCGSTYDVPVRHEISRGSPEVAPYSVYAGPLTGDAPRVGKLLLDRADWDLPGQAGVASVSLYQGWAMLTRPRGMPPIRTIRTTTGRPALTDSTTRPDLVIQEEGRDDAAKSQTYSMLVAIQPGSDATRGLEYIFMREEKEDAHTTMKFFVRLSDGSMKYASIKAGEYIVFNRATSEWIGARPLPTIEELSRSQAQSFVKEALCAALRSSGQKFFRGDTDPCK